MTTPASPSVRDLVERLSQVDESSEIEAKRSESEVGKSALETISAFSNEPGLKGGYLLFGVVEDGATGRHTVAGVREQKKTEQELSTLCASAFNRTIRPRIWTEIVDGKPVVAAFIPEASPQEKPVFIKARGPHAGSFRRIGSTDQRCTEDDLRVLFRAADTAAFEDTALQDASEEDLDPGVVATYRKQLLDTNPATELRDAAPLELVQAVGGGRREGGRLVPTVAGLLLFGKRLALRRLFPQLRVDYIRVPGTQWVPDTERRYDSIEIRDPLLLAFRRGYQAVVDDLPRSFVLEPGSPERRDRAAVPETVVREAVVNALTHRDYRVASATQIIRFSDRIEIRNPGYSLVGEEQFGQPGSFPRNPRIADVFREMGLAENKGTGIEAMRRAMKRADLTPPVFISDPRHDRFVATLWFHSLLDDHERAWLDGLGLDLSVAQRQAMVVARRTGTVTNSGLRDLTGLDPLQARRELHFLRDARLLKMVGERGGAHYEIGPAAGAASQRATGQTRQEEPDGSTQAEPDQGGAALQVGSDRGESGDDRGELQDDRGELSARKRALATLPREVQELVLGLGKKPPKERLRQAIVRMAELRAWKPAELSAALGLVDPAKLTERHLSPMVTGGLLERTHPENPTHPDQAYRTRQKPLPSPNG